jgi:two-component system sensor histidine kinase VanS
MLLLAVLIGAMFFFFSDQIRTVVTLTQQHNTTAAFRPLLEQLHSKPPGEIAEFAQRFHEQNASFEFRFEDANGELIYQTEGFTLPDGEVSISMSPERMSLGDTSIQLDGSAFGQAMPIGDGEALFVMTADNGVSLYVFAPVAQNDVLASIWGTILFALLIIVAASLVAALLLARRIARPVQQIALDTHRMSALEDVDSPTPRNDEIGDLAQDVYKMYRNLQQTIRNLEEEIEREREMEESQRYFFAAASHELKTPIAACASILEGMETGVIEPEEYSRYLRECMALLAAQNRLVTEILEVVKLNDVALRPRFAPVSLATAIDTALAAHLLLAERNELVVTVDVPAHLTVCSDAGLLQKALSNLILNALQNTPPQGSIHIFTGAVKDAECISLSIQNTPAQVPEQILHRLSEPFFHADPARTRSQGRSGLGLTIVKKSLDLMQASFQIQNTPDSVLVTMELSAPKEPLPS